MLSQHRKYRKTPALQDKPLLSEYYFGTHRARYLFDNWAFAPFLVRFCYLVQEAEKIARNPLFGNICYFRQISYFVSF